MAKIEFSGIDDVINDLEYLANNIPFECPDCNAEFDIDLSKLPDKGGVVACPHCAANIEVTFSEDG